MRLERSGGASRDKKLGAMEGRRSAGGQAQVETEGSAVTVPRPSLGQPLSLSTTGLAA